MKRNATQRHDLVYALLGLASSHIIPDYEAQIPDIFVAVSEEHIRLTVSLLPLSYAGRRKSPALQDLPTWVVDLSVPNPRRDPNPKALDWFVQIPHFSASGGLVLDDEVTIIDRQLVLRGINFDRVQVTSHEILFEGRGSPNLFTLCDCDGVDEQALHASLHEKQPVSLWISAPEVREALYPGGGTRTNAWWRTMLRDHGWGSTKPQRATDRHLSTLDILNEFWATSQDPWSEGISGHLKQSARTDESFFSRNASEDDMGSNSLLIPTVHEHLMDLRKKKFFLTEKGYLGLARKEVSAKHKDTRYESVGDCYIHGIMDGEAISGAHYTMQRLAIL